MLDSRTCLQSFPAMLVEDFPEIQTRNPEYQTLNFRLVGFPIGNLGNPCFCHVFGAGIVASKFGVLGCWLQGTRYGRNAESLAGRIRAQSRLPISAGFGDVRGCKALADVRQIFQKYLYMRSSGSLGGPAEIKQSSLEPVRAASVDRSTAQAVERKGKCRCGKRDWKRRAVVLRTGPRQTPQGGSQLTRS